MRRAALIGLLVLAALALAALASRPPVRSMPTPQPVLPATARAVLPEPGRPEATPAAPELLRAELARARELVGARELPRSLRGTTPDGKLRLDARGELVRDLELRRRFDYFLSATGEEPPEVIRARLVLQLAQLPERAAGQGLIALDRYLGLRALRPAPLPPSADPAARLDAVRQVRREQLGEDLAQAFFGDEEAAAGAPARDEAAQPAPDEAARRRQQLDAQRADWTGRLEEFRRQRDAIRSAAELGEAQKAEAIEALLAASFGPGERLRLRALGEAPPAR